MKTKDNTIIKEFQCFSRQYENKERLFLVDTTKIKRGWDIPFFDYIEIKQNI